MFLRQATFLIDEKDGSEKKTIEKPAEETKQAQPLSAGKSGTTQQIHSILLTTSPEKNLSDPLAPRSPVTRLGVSVGFKINYPELIFGDQVGIGGSSKVFSGFWRGQAVAIKQLTFPLGAESKKKDYIEVFKHEATVMEELQSTHLPSVMAYAGYAENTEKSSYCLVMEYIPQCAFEWLASGSFKKAPWSVRYRVLEDTLSAVSDLHKIRWIHADLKWTNVMLTTGMQPIVSDFAQSFKLPEGEEYTIRPMFVGTPQYMAPETLLEKRYGFASDVFSAAGMIFEMIYGGTPFSGYHQDRVIDLVKKGYVYPANPSWPCPPKAKEIMLRCSQLNPSNRPSMFSVVKDVAGLREEEEKAISTPRI